MRSVYCCFLVFLIIACRGNRTSNKEEHLIPSVSALQSQLHQYENQLLEFRQEFGGVRDLPDIEFFLFGMGARPKLIYKNGTLLSFASGEVLRSWDVRTSVIIPNEYAVVLFLMNGEVAILHEDEEGIWITANDQTERVPLSERQLSLPEFKSYRFNQVLKVLHHEILINIVDGHPLPNYFVYQKPWRRDAAMMAMCLKQTGNLDLIREWVVGLSDPYDHNNGQKRGQPEDETDNLGQTLYLISLFSDASHPLVDQIILELPKYEVEDQYGKYVKGRSDFQEVPVYQTKWLVYGLKELGIKHDFNIPLMADNYSSLFWWAFKDVYVKADYGKSDKYPYLGWARDHFSGDRKGLISNRLYPLTWEIQASEADYRGMTIIDSVYTNHQISVPHTWHAAEVFLYLSDLYKLENK